MLGQTRAPTAPPTDPYHVARAGLADDGPEKPEPALHRCLDEVEFERLLEENAARRRALDHRRTAVYRLFDAAGVLLYVGISVDPQKRFKNHKHGNGRNKPKEWWPDVVTADLEWFDSRPQAETAESFAIVTEHPRHNTAKTGAYAASLFRHRWLQERLGGPRPGPDAPLARWRAWAEATVEIDGHEMPAESWWEASRPCNRLIAEQRDAAARLGRPVRAHVPRPLRAEDLIRLTRHRHGHCELCREPYPCATVRAVADRFTNHPQYTPLWGAQASAS
ncbi:GIY-YIG nuclease family protein [Streptomycetaceae bacterium NBC_01309]